MVNEARGKVLRDHGIRTIEDLLWYLPFRYEDWRTIRPISELQDGESVTIHCRVSRVALHITPRQRFKILEISAHDATGRVTIRFFNQPYLKDQFTKGQKVLLHGQA